MTQDNRVIGGLEARAIDFEVARAVELLAEEKLFPNTMTVTPFDIPDKKKGAIIFNGPNVDLYGENVVSAFKEKFPNLCDVLDVFYYSGKITKYDPKTVLVVRTQEQYETARKNNPLIN